MKTLLKMQKQYLTIKETAILLGVTPLTLRNWDKKGKLVARRHPVNNYRVYKLVDIEQLLQEIEDGPPKPKKLRVDFIDEEQA